MDGPVSALCGYRVWHRMSIPHCFRFKQENVGHSVNPSMADLFARRTDPAGSSAANRGLPRLAIAVVADHVGDESCSKTKSAAMISAPNGRELVRVGSRSQFLCSPLSPIQPNFSPYSREIEPILTRRRLSRGLTMYDEAMFFIANPINRYSMSMRTDLKLEPDGSDFHWILRILRRG
jgi:hypothetical protein